MSLTNHSDQCNLLLCYGAASQLKTYFLRRCFIAFGFFVFSCSFFPSPALSRPCHPNDPDGENPGNLCLTFPPAWSPLPGASSAGPPFIQGTGTSAYYGVIVNPGNPGQPVRRTSGFWTSIDAVNGSTIITDSNGHSIALP